MSKSESIGTAGGNFLLIGLHTLIVYTWVVLATTALGIIAIGIGDEDCRDLLPLRPGQEGCFAIVIDAGGEQIAVPLTRPVEIEERWIGNCIGVPRRSQFDGVGFFAFSLFIASCEVNNPKFPPSDA